MQFRNCGAQLHIFLLCTFCTFALSRSKVQIVQIVQCHFLYVHPFSRSKLLVILIFS